MAFFVDYAPAQYIATNDLSRLILRVRVTLISLYWGSSASFIRSVEYCYCTSVSLSRTRLHRVMAGIMSFQMVA